MAVEYETKVLDIGAQEVKKKLKEIGAKRESESLMRRWVFIIESGKEEWIRLRDDGSKTTVTYKCKSGSGISETEEIEVEVGDFEKAADMFSMIYKEKYYQENKRELYKLGDIEFTIDTWPRIPKYLEIESTSEEKVRKGLGLLGLTNKDCGNLSVISVYAKYGFDLHSFKELKF